LILSSSLFLNIYSFLSIPDTPLLFFTALFFYIYRRYLQNEKLYNVIALAVVTTLLLYSKYHGILIIGFTICSNPKLFYRKSFYITLFISIILFMPHIVWQYQNNYPTLKFHLFDKESTFKLQNVISYVSEQLGVTGSIFLLLFSVLLKCKTSFQKTLKFNVIGVFVFFLFSSFKENHYCPIKIWKQE
jgi:4-amino-4-deoxy-L-arabinose transferase-like glycosyltransferase